MRAARIQRFVTIAKHRMPEGRFSQFAERLALEKDVDAFESRFCIGLMEFMISDESGFNIEAGSAVEIAVNEMIEYHRNPSEKSFWKAWNLAHTAERDADSIEAFHAARVLRSMRHLDGASMMAGALCWLVVEDEEPENRLNAIGQKMESVWVKISEIAMEAFSS